MHLDVDPDELGPNDAAERRRLQHIVERLDAIERELDDVAERKRQLNERSKALAENRRALINAARDPQLTLGFAEADVLRGRLYLHPVRHELSARDVDDDDDDEVVLLERDAAGNVSARVDPNPFDDAVDESLRKATKASSRPKTSKRKKPGALLPPSKPPKASSKTKAKATSKAKVTTRPGLDPGRVYWPDEGEETKGGEL